MQNLLSSDSKYRLVYWLAWAVLGLLYAALLIFVWSVDWQLSIIDALTFTLLFAVMGIAVWYIVRFSDVDQSNLVNTLVTHLVAGSLLVFGVVVIAETTVIKPINKINQWLILTPGKGIALTSPS